MAYNYQSNRYNGNSYGNSNGYQSNQGYQKKSYSQGPKKKFSGCKVRMNVKSRSGEVKELLVTGWLKTRNGIISYVGTKSANKFQTTDNVKLSIKVTQGIDSNLFWGTYNPITQMVYIQGLNVCGMPSKNSSFFRKSR